MYRELALIIVSIGLFGGSVAQNDVGAGTLYRLNVVADVWLEQPTVNYNSTLELSKIDCSVL